MRSRPMSAAPLPLPAGGNDASSGQVERLLSAASVLKELAGVDWEAGQAKAVVQAAEAITRSVTVIQANALNAAQASGTWTTDGQRTFDSWVTSHTGTTRATAGRAVKLSKSLQQVLPATRNALVEGTISTDHAQL